MMKDRKSYKMGEIRQLTKQWYKILQDSGFRDIEMAGGIFRDGPLRITYDSTIDNCKAEYYYRAQQLIREYIEEGSRTFWELVILSLHSDEAYGYRQICSALDNQVSQVEVRKTLKQFVGEVRKV